MHFDIRNNRQEYAHIVVMPHADRKVLNEFLGDLEQDTAENTFKG
jgi:hypothetical protein